jgi:hyperosmotically inducible periplasmic protein
MTSKIVAALMTVFLFAAVCMAADKVVSDDMIYDNVRIKLASDQVVKGGALEVDVKDGVVTLGGMVENSRQKDRAAKLAKSVKGVKQVINKLNLKEPTAK